MHVDHLSPDGVHDIALRGGDFFIQVILLALELPRQQLALPLEPGFFVTAQRAGAIGEPTLKILNLFLHVLKIRLLRIELGLQLRRGLLAFGGSHDGLADIDDANLICPPCRACACLRPCRSRRKDKKRGEWHP